MKKYISVLLAVILTALTATPALSVSAAETKPNIELVEGTYAPGQVIVQFRDSAINTKTVPKKDDLESVGANFGNTMDASSSEREALGAADEEQKILKNSLGNDFVLEDTLVFGDDTAESKGGASVGAGANTSFDDLTVALVSSDKYDTAALIEKLGKNKNVAKVEPNFYVHPTSFTPYSLNDPYNRYLYNVNSPLAENTGGESVSDFGANPETIPSVNASFAWSKLSGSEKEAVVAVIDTGVLAEHEDLQEIMWTNPGNIGLKGEHGYDFVNNDDDPTDDHGHGTHCSGIIAAQANNAKGIAGVASAANVKIMALKMLSGSGNSMSSTVYQTFGCYHYIYKAIQGGVNVVGINNSWAGFSYGTIYDDLINLLGEEGAISYIAAGNECYDNDRMSVYPANSESDYAVTVGAANNYGQSTEFSNYGKTSVDVFGPGLNILSSVSYDNYTPGIYSADLLNATTEYYGEFNSKTKIVDGKITPSVGSRAGKDIKSFGEIKFVKQRYLDDDDEYEIPDDAKLELSVEPEGRLKITVKNAQYGELYFIYFPYEKNPKTTGGNNTYFSMCTECIKNDDDSIGIFSGGEIYEDEDGLQMTEDGMLVAVTAQDYDKMKYITTNIGKDFLLSAEDAEDKELGFGISLYANCEMGDSQDASMYLENLAISKPDIEIEPNTSYDYNSGTSQATPAVCAAGALINALYPRQKGESGGDYAKRIRAKLFSCVRRTDAFKDLCSTGGYVDLSLINEAVPSLTDAVCDVENETLTLYGSNLYKGSKLTYRRLAVDGAKESPLPDKMSVKYTRDGKKLVISNAKSLFSTYTAFTVTAQNGTQGGGKFFLVKGQNKLTEINTHIIPNDSEFTMPYLLTDSGGNNLYGFYNTTGEVCCYDGNQFNTYKNTNIYEAFRKDLVESGKDTYTVYNEYDLYCILSEAPISINENGVIYTFIGVNRPPENDDSDEEYEGSWWYEQEAFLASFDLNSDDHKWRFTELSEYPEALLYGFEPRFKSCFCNGRFYCIGDYYSSEATENSLPMYSYDPAKDLWEKEHDLPVIIDSFDFAAINDKLYVMYGSDPDTFLSDEERILNCAWCFDGISWEKSDLNKYVGRINKSYDTLYHSDAITQVKNGLVFIGASVDGGGNMFLYNTEKDKIEPLYCSVNDSISDSFDHYNSCVTTRDGIYYIYHYLDDENVGWKLCLLPESSGLYESPYEKPLLGDVDGDGTVTILDVTCIQRKLSGFKVQDYNEKAADADGDGTVTISDATCIQRYLAGFPSPLK